MAKVKLNEKELFKEIEKKGLSYYYDLYNKKYFNNELRDIKVKWNKRMIKTIGQYKCKIFSNKNKIEDILEEEVSLSYKVIKHKPSIFKDVLLHEMIHVKYPFDSHGAKFQKEAKRLNDNYGCNITIYNKDKLSDELFNYIYVCSNGCNTKIQRMRKMDTKKYVCSNCRGDLVLANNSDKNDK